MHENQMQVVPESKPSANIASSLYLSTVNNKIFVEPGTMKSKHKTMMLDSKPK